MAYVAGFHGGMDDSTVFAPNLAALSVAREYIRLMPGGMGKLSAILDLLGAGSATNIEHFWYTKTMVNPEITSTVADAAGVTTMTFASTAPLLPGMMLQNQRTFEQILISTIVSATQATVRRATGTTAAAAANINDVWTGIGTAFEEGSNRPNAAAISPVRVANFTQIFRNAWAVTDTLRQMQAIAGEGIVAENKRDCVEFHMRDQEAAIIFGEAIAPSAGVTLNGRPLHKMNGIINAVRAATGNANVFTAGATTNYTQLEAFLDPCFNSQTDPRVGNERLLLAGGQAVRVLNAIARLNSQYQITNDDGPTEANFGLSFKTFTMPRGTFKLMEHPMLNFHTAWSKMAIAVDLSSWKKMYLGDRRAKAEEYGAADKSGSIGNDSSGGSLTSEFTLEYKNAATSVVIYNLTAGATG